jgi:hypothetical protein
MVVDQTYDPVPAPHADRKYVLWFPDECHPLGRNPRLNIDAAAFVSNFSDGGATRNDPSTVVDGRFSRMNKPEDLVITDRT